MNGSLGQLLPLVHYPLRSGSCSRRAALTVPPLFIPTRPSLTAMATRLVLPLALYLCACTRMPSAPSPFLKMDYVRGKRSPPLRRFSRWCRRTRSTRNDTLSTPTHPPTGLVTGSSDCSVRVSDTSGACVWRVPRAHGAAVNVARALLPTGGLVASGDDDGCVKLWDTRLPAGSAPVTLSEASDIITDILVDEARGVLLSGGGDGCLRAYDLRRPGRVLGASAEGFEDELLSLAPMKGGAAVVAGTQEGSLLTWAWGEWGADPDVFRGHPESVDCLLPLDADALITGSSDGILRLCTLAPNKLVGLIGEHGSDPIERLAWDRSHSIVASASHDNTVRLWDVRYLHEGEEGSIGSSSGTRRSRFVDLPALTLPKSKRAAREEEEEDEEEEEGEEEEGEEEDEEDDEVDETMEPGSARAPPGKGGVGKGKKGAGGFFADL